MNLTFRMQSRRVSSGMILLAVLLGGSSTLFGQAGANRRGNPGGPQSAGQNATQAAAPQTNSQPGAPQVAAPPATPPPGEAGRTAAGGRGGQGAPPAPDTFYDFDPNAGQVRAGQKFDAPPVETHGKITWHGQPLAYTATAGFLPLPNATTGLPEAHLFFTSYVKEGESEDSRRPLMFFLGGAPGVSPAWQEFGGLGPKRMKAEGGWGENPNSVLGESDLVFVNPVGTGYSVPAQANRGSIFWNTQGDIGSLAAFIRLYVARYSREGSPLFLAGEDAGTGRVAGLATYLNEHAVPVRGIVLLSVANSPDAVTGDTQYITMLPNLVVASWYHKKLSPDMNGMSEEQIAGQARQLASREYLHALYKGDRMGAEERAKVVADLARMTGLSKQFVISNNLRIGLDRYNAELMRDDHRALSKIDARVAGFQPPAPAFGFGGGGGGRNALNAAPPPQDFYLNEISGPFAAAYQAYLRRELNFNGSKDAVFYLNSGGIGTFTSTANDATSITSAFAGNPKMRLFVSVNSFDLGAPFYATEYTLAHLNVSPEVRAHNIRVSHESAGRMAYMDSKASAKLQQDLASFVEEAVK